MNTESQIDLYPCPFCGKSQAQGFVHEEACFFKLSEALKASNGQDVALAQKVVDAWRTRVTPEGYKLVPVQIHQDYAADWGSKYRRTAKAAAAVELQDLLVGYADLIAAVESPWKSQS